MNAHAQWRLDFAHTLSTHLQQFTAIEAIAVVGSVARDYSDSYSDLELLVVWDQLPTPDQHATLVRALQAEYRYPVFDPGYQSAFRIQGIPVDLWHTTRANEHAVIHSVLHEWSLDLVANNRVDTLRSCLPLYGEQHVHVWQASTAAYPSELALRFIQSYIPHFHLRHLNFAAHRDNPTAFYHTLSAIHCSLFLVLLALNESYFPTFKWMYPALRRMRHTPHQIAARLHAMFHKPPIHAADHLRVVLAETLDLVERAYPQIDTAYARYGLDQEPLAYSQPHPW
ncbi:MAG TPA: nucleotidyltransferase domain-containing protein [Herpetosiphonaceae bacterium]